eukprot:2447388-Rhodomonas_salina.1
MDETPTSYVVAPGLEGVAYSKKFLLARSIVYLCWYQLTRVEGYGAELTVDFLHQGCANGVLTSVSDQY